MLCFEYHISGDHQMEHLEKAFAGYIFGTEPSMQRSLPQHLWFLDGEGHSTLPSYCLTPGSGVFQISGFLCIWNVGINHVNTNVKTQGLVNGVEGNYSEETVNILNLSNQNSQKKFPLKKKCFFVNFGLKRLTFLQYPLYNPLLSIMRPYVFTWAFTWLTPTF